MAEPRPELLPLQTFVQDLCPDVTRLLSLLGEPVDGAFISAFVGRYGESWYNTLVDESLAVRHFSEFWAVAHGRKYWELFELLVAEHWISSRPAIVSQHLNPRMQLDKTVHTVRAAIGLALYSRAKSVNWREPLTFVRALRVAERYLRGVVDNRQLSRPTAQEEYEGRLGVALVLQARYIQLSTKVLEEATTFLRSSIAGGNESPEAYTYLAEAWLRQHDASGSRHHLEELLSLSNQLREQPRTLLFDSYVAESWLRLSPAVTRVENRTRALQRGKELAQSHLRSSDGLAACRAAVIIALADTMAAPRYTGVLSLRGLRIPFNLKMTVRAWAQEMGGGATKELLENIIHNLGEVSPSVRSEPLYRRLLATAHSQLARVNVRCFGEQQRRRELQAAVDLRAAAGARSALSDPESRLENSVDLFALYRITRNPAVLLRALQETLQLADFDQAWPTPLLVLARELPDIRDSLTAPLAYRLRQTQLRRGSEVLERVLAADSQRLYSIAAERALLSREVDRKNLGGRNGVYLAEDYSGIVSEQFVFKPTKRALAAREEERAKRIASRIKHVGLEDRFSVADTLARSELPPDDRHRRQGDDVIVARQFHVGRLLPDSISDGDLGRRTFVLDRVGQFLALMHGCETRADESPTAVRKELKKQEMGRWLRTLHVANQEEVFGSWYGMFPATLPMLTRRDAHPLNWIITSGDEVVALDFEACGWRPAGYEVAQLLDDQPMLPVDATGWDARRHVLRSYGRSLRKAGLPIDGRDLSKSYQVSLLARAVKLLTEPRGSNHLREHGEKLLAWLGSESGWQDVKSLASLLAGAWETRRGAATASPDSRTVISDARRRRLSRAMAYELRHGKDVLLDKRGWAYLASVADALNKSGFRTSKAELAVVAGALDEPRFELVAPKVRARYGHTRPVEIVYEEVEKCIDLFHGTAMRNVNAILARSEGLLPMGRLWVHLSSNPAQALLTSERHGPGVLLACNTCTAPVDVVSAGGSVHLAKHVPAQALRIVTPTQLFFEVDSADGNR